MPDGARPGPRQRGIMGAADCMSLGGCSTSIATSGVAVMATISKGNELLTLINVFTVEPVNQQELVDLLSQATRASVRYVKGFVSASLHRSLDGAKVAMYAQWRSVEDYHAMRSNPTASPYMQKASRSRGPSSGCTRWSRPSLRQPPNPQMQPTGRDGPAAPFVPRASLRPINGPLFCGRRSRLPAADLPFVRRPPGFPLGRLSLQEELVLAGPQFTTLISEDPNGSADCLNIEGCQATRKPIARQ